MELYSFIYGMVVGAIGTIVVSVLLAYREYKAEQRFLEKLNAHEDHEKENGDGDEKKW